MASTITPPVDPRASAEIGPSRSWRARMRLVALVGVVLAAALAGLPIALAIVVTALVLVPLERLRPRRRQRALRPDLATDLTHLVIGLPLGGAAALVPTLFIERGIGDGLALDESLATFPLLTFVVAFLLVELVAYWAHRAMHVVPILWRFHQVHHSIEEMDWISGVRIHPLGIVINAVLKGIPLALLGVEREFVGALALLVGVSAVLTHSNLDVRLRPLHRWWVTPDFHHWHHATDADAIDTNFGGLTPIWDRVFGTYHLPTDRRPTAYGVLGRETPATWRGQLLMPFR